MATLKGPPPRYDTWRVNDLATAAVHLGLARAVAEQMEWGRLVAWCFTEWHRRND